MHHYSLFGGTLRSTVTLPDFTPCRRRAATWTFRVDEARGPRLPELLPRELLGTIITPDCAVGLLRTGSGLRLRHRCAGSYDISADGRDVAWRPVRGAIPELACIDLVARVMPVALHAGGAFCLHGSAVVVNGIGLGFVADSGVGKSTISVALRRAGALMVSDDVLITETTDSGVRLRPGFARPRLRSDVAGVLLDDGEPFIDAIDGKHVIRDLDDASLGAEEAVPLSTVYVLRPVSRRESQRAVRRVALPPTAATLALIRFAKVGPLLGGSEGGVVLRRAAAFAAAVRVYDLHVVRDLARLDDVAYQLLAWHGAHALAPAV